MSSDLGLITTSGNDGVCFSLRLCFCCGLISAETIRKRIARARIATTASPPPIAAPIMGPADGGACEADTGPVFATGLGDGESVGPGVSVGVTEGEVVGVGLDVIEAVELDVIEEMGKGLSLDVCVFVALTLIVCVFVALALIVVLTLIVCVFVALTLIDGVELSVGVPVVDGVGRLVVFVKSKSLDAKANPTTESKRRSILFTVHINYRVFLTLSHID